MDSQERALLETILAQLDDDGPRLVYADWLEEQGDCDRAEFIRVQIEREQRDAYDPAQKALVRREFELIDAHRAEWVEPSVPSFVTYYPPPDEPAFEPLDPGTTREMMPQPRWHFRRGFPWIEVSAGQFLTHSATLLGAAPVVQLHIGPASVNEMLQRSRDPGSMRPRRAIFRDLLAAPALPQTGIGLTLVEESDWEQLFAPPRKLRITALHSRGATAYVWHLRELARFPGLARLSELLLHQMNLTDPYVREIIASPCLAHLRTLGLRGNHIGPDGVASLTAAPCPGRLRTLDLSDNPIGDAGALQLARWPGLASVRVLRLEGCRLGPRGAAALAASPYLTNLTQLGLQRNQIRGAGVAALLKRDASWVIRLARLDLCGNRIGSLGAQELTTAAPFLPRLRRLYLSLDGDDLSELHLRWLSEAYDERFKVDWFAPPR